MTETRGSVVYLGSSLCSDLDTYLALNPERIYLIEPNPDVADDLAQLCDAHATVEHLTFGVTVTGGRQRLHVYNFFDLSSFSEPQDLLEVYPGALVEAAPDVQTLTPAELVARLNLPDAASHRLVVETTGIEHALLEAFITSDTLGAFGYISVRMPIHTLFAGSRCIAQVDALLESAGYQKTLPLAGTGNTDWQMYHYRFDPQAYRSIKLAEENAALEHALEQTSATLAQTTTALTAERDQARADAEAAETQRKDVAGKAESLEAQNAALTAERDQARADAEAAEAQRKDVAGKAESLEAHNAALTAERDQARADAEAAETQRKDVAGKAESLEALHMDRVMALRVQTRLQSSYLELQERFEALQTQYATQQTLIATLVEQLEKIVPASKPVAKKTLPSKARTRKTGATEK